MVCFRIDFFLLDNIFLLNPGSELFDNVALWLLCPTAELEASLVGSCTVLRVLERKMNRKQKKKRER